MVQLNQRSDRRLDPVTQPGSKPPLTKVRGMSHAAAASVVILLACSANSFQVVPSAQSSCAILKAVLASAVDTARAVAVMREEANGSFGDPLPTWYKDFITNTARELQVARSAVAFFLDPRPRPANVVEIPDCGGATGTRWRADPPRFMNDTVLVGLSGPLIDRYGTIAIVLGVVRDPPRPQPTGQNRTLSTGYIGVDGLYVLEQRSGHWQVVRSFPVRYLTRQ